MGGVPLRFAGNAGLGLTLWMLSRLRGMPLARPGLYGRRVPLERRGHRRHGGHHYGRSTGVAGYELPAYASRVLLIGQAFISFSADYYLFLPPPSAVVSQLVVPDCGIGGVPVDRGHGTLVVGGNPGTRRGTDSRGALDGDQPAANLARLHGAGGNTIFYSEDHRPRIIQPSMGGVRVLDAADPRRLG